MRKTLLMTAALLGLAAMPAFAGNPLSTTQSPPSHNSAEAGVQSDNRLPPTADTSNHDGAGSQLGRGPVRLPVIAEQGAMPGDLMPNRMSAEPHPDRRTLHLSGQRGPALRLAPVARLAAR